MSRIGRITKSILVWSYERGTIQYDIICALILAFIFLVPQSCFDSKKADQKYPEPKSITSDKLPAKAHTDR
jgi:hypothetical protein